MLRLLGMQGYILKHAQDPRTELDLSVATLATDLRSGIRLCRLVDALSGMSRQVQAIMVVQAACAGLKLANRISQCLIRKRSGMVSTRVVFVACAGTHLRSQGMLCGARI